MRKMILYGKEARDKIKDGIDKVANAVITTLGPRGRNVVIAKSSTSPTGMQYYQPIVTKDGVTVARNIMLDDYLENVGCLMIREASEKTMAMCGDGTTTTCLFVQAIVREGLKLIDEGVNPQELKKSIDAAVEYVVSELKKMAIPVGEGVDRIRQIATVSANNDKSIGNLIADAFEKIGHEGIITIEESKNDKTEIKIVDGFEFNRGYKNTYFINDTAKMICEMTGVNVFLYDKKLYQPEPMERLFSEIVRSNKPILIVCDDADGQALAIMQAGVQQKQWKMCIVQSPSFGDDRVEQMEDIAILTGGTYVSDEKGVSLSEAGLKYCGYAEKVTISKDKTTIIGGRQNKKELDDLLNNLRMNLTQATPDEKEKIEKRIAKLTGGVAALHVGAATETEMQERKDRCDDAVRAVKSAISEGVVPGGGSSFKAINMQRDDDGSKIIASVIKEPFAQICKNAGVSDFEIEEFVIDPVKVLRCALENASSTATMILTSESLICDVL